MSCKKCQQIQWAMISSPKDQHCLHWAMWPTRNKDNSFSVAFINLRKKKVARDLLRFLWVWHWKQTLKLQSRACAASVNSVWLCIKQPGLLVWMENKHGKKKKIPLHFDLICFGLLLWCDRATHHSLFAHFHTSPVSSDSKLVYFHYLHIELYLIWL